MPSSEADLLGREWTTLQRNCERYEHSALWIKLAAPMLYAVALVYGFDAAISCVLVAVLWLQEAMLRTSQSRLTTRLMRVEALLRETAPRAGSACQLHTEWTAARPGSAGLLGEYAANALRPTVALPYAVLIVLLMALALDWA